MAVKRPHSSRHHQPDALWEVIVGRPYSHQSQMSMDEIVGGVQAAARQMRTLNKSGRIIPRASMGGVSGAGITVAYSTSKGGVLPMAKSLADALSTDGIRVNAAAPGTIDTELLRTSPG